MRRKAPTLSNSTTNSETQSSGISSLVLPKLFKYPNLYSFEEYSNKFKDIFCYIISHYSNEGITVLIKRYKERDQVVIICGDWLGNVISIDSSHELSKYVKSLMQGDISDYIKIMRYINIEQAQLYFSINNGCLVLVDMQVSINKFVGPGMLRDIFGKTKSVQVVKQIKILDEVALEAIRSGSGDYEGNLIIKPTRFRMNYDNNGMFNPMYAEVIR